MCIFDLHCDTLNRCLDEGESLLQNSGQLDLLRGNQYDGWVQVYACWLDSKYQGEEAFARFLRQRNILFDAVSLYPHRIVPYSGQIEKGRCMALLSVEGGHALGGKIENIARMKQLGVAFFTLLWNGDNELGSGALKGQERGLTPFGKACLGELERNRIIIDISHLNDRGVEDVFSMAQRPVVATHSNLRSVCGSPRNLTDAQFKELVRRGGICGINFYPAFVNGEKDYSPEALRRHIERMLELGGEKTIALGSDFDGASMPSFIKGIESLYMLRKAVVEWLGAELADRLFYKNAAEFAARNL